MQSVHKISATAIFFISFLWIILGINKIQVRQRLQKVKVPADWTFSSSASKKVRYFEFPESASWKFKKGGYIKYPDNSVLLPISKKKKIKKFKEYTWVPSTEDVVVKTNDLEFIEHIKIIAKDNEERPEISE